MIKDAVVSLGLCLVLLADTVLTFSVKRTALQQNNHHLRETITSETELSSSSQCRCSDLIEHLKQQGSYIFEGISIQRYNDNSEDRTIVATQDICKGQVLLRLPIEVGMTPSRAIATNSIVAEAVAANNGSSSASEEEEKMMNPSDLLAIWLLTERATNPQSPYIHSLPTMKEMEHFPIFWNNDDISWLAITDVGMELQQRKKKEMEFYTKFTQQCCGFSQICPTFESWMWSKCNVQSRAFTIANPTLLHNVPRQGTCIGEVAVCNTRNKVDIIDNNHHETETPSSSRNEEVDTSSTSNNSNVPAMFPMADMFNHVKRSNGCTCEWGIDRDTSDFVIRTIHDVKAGSEVTVSYGEISTSASLLNYGFIGENNKQQHYHLQKEQHDEKLGYREESCYLDDFVSIKVSLDKIRNCNTFYDNVNNRQYEENHMVDRQNCNDHDSDNMSSPSQEQLLAMQHQIWNRDEGRYPDFSWEPKERMVAMGVGTAGAANTLMSLLRVGVATTDEMIQIQEANLYANGNDDDGEQTTIAAMIAREPVSWRNERAALLTFENIVELQIQTYSTSRMSQKMQQEILNENQKNALKVQHAEISVLKHWRFIAQLAGNVLEEKRNSFDFGLKYPKLFDELLQTTEAIPTK